jgi:glycerophosphoryl diester phosphodiesterase
MSRFEIVAHRGIPSEAPENTIASFQRAVELGSDAVELDVRLTSDRMPVVYHYFYLQETTSALGTIFDFTLEQLRNVKVFCKNNPAAKEGHISTLSEILEVFGGKIGLEIEIKGPEQEAPEIIGNVLNKFLTPHVHRTPKEHRGRPCGALPAFSGKRLQEANSASSSFVRQIPPLAVPRREPAVGRLL